VRSKGLPKFLEPCRNVEVLDEYSKFGIISYFDIFVVLAKLPV
jgi:hypothetical protein